MHLLYTDTSTHRGFYTKKEVFTYQCFVQRCFCAHKSWRVGIFTHRTFPTEKPLHRTNFTQRFFGIEKYRLRKLMKIVHTDCAKKNTHQIFCAQKLCPEQFLHSRNSMCQGHSLGLWLQHQFSSDGSLDVARRLGPQFPPGSIPPPQGSHRAVESERPMQLDPCSMGPGGAEVDAGPHQAAICGWLRIWQDRPQTKKG